MKSEVNFFEFFNKFPNEEACVKFLEKSRWGEGEIKSLFADCGVWRIKTRLGLYKCAKTKRQFTVRQGTIFEESRLPLQKWFMAIFLLHSLKKGISSIQLGKYLGITQKSAWFLLHRIRYAIEHKNFSKPLDGIVEVDEHYSGGKTKGGKRGRGAEKKTPIFGIAQRQGELRCGSVENVKKATLEPIIRKNVEIGARVMSDEFLSYNGLEKAGYAHEVVKHREKEYVRGNIHTNTLEGFWSHFKRGVKAIQIHVSKKHLNKYCKEYEFRYNSRFLNDFDRFNTWFSVCEARMTYTDLVRPAHLII